MYSRYYSKVEEYSPIRDAQSNLEVYFREYGPQATLELVQTLVVTAEKLVGTYVKETGLEKGKAEFVLQELAKMNNQNLDTRDISIENIAVESK